MAEIIDFSAKRKETVEKKKRQYERIFFDELIACYSAIESHDQTLPVKVLDISKSGCRLEVSRNSVDESFPLGSEMTLRLYFTKKSFISVVAKVVRNDDFTNLKGLNVAEYGLEFDQSLPGHRVLESFVEFVGKFAEYSRIDSELDRVNFF